MTVNTLKQTKIDASDRVKVALTPEWRRVELEEIPEEESQRLVIALAAVCVALNRTVDLCLWVEERADRTLRAPLTPIPNRGDVRRVRRR